MVWFYTLKRKAADCSEASVNQTTRRQIPEDGNLNTHRHETLRSHIASGITGILSLLTFQRRRTKDQLLLGAPIRRYHSCVIRVALHTSYQAFKNEWVQVWSFLMDMQLSIWMSLTFLWSASFHTEPTSTSHKIFWALSSSDNQEVKTLLRDNPGKVVTQYQIEEQ
jgi:hypothetical protein